MKPVQFFMAFALWVVMIGCTGVKSVSRGLENESYLEFTGDPAAYSGGVQVTINDTIHFTATITKTRASVSIPKYAVKPGKQWVSVRYNDKLIFSKQLFLSTQETRIIELP